MPAHIDAVKVKAWLAARPGVAGVHDLHIWGMSTTEVALTAHLLMPGGRLHFVSDVPDYFEMVTTTLAGLPNFRRLPPPDAAEPKHDMDYLTNFERKFRKQGKPIHRAIYETPLC